MIARGLAVTLTGLCCLNASRDRPAAAARGPAVMAGFFNPEGTTMEMAGRPSFVAGPVTNHGTLKITDTTVTYAGAFTNHGAYVSDPSTNNFTDLIIGTNGFLAGGAGDKFVVSRDMTNASLQSASWNTTAAELSFRAGGAAAHNMSLAGRDLGASFFGTIANFAWGTLRLRAGESLTLTDGNAIQGAAFYADELVLEGGTPQAGSITGNGFNIYYNPWAVANAYLGAQTWPLNGGGSLIPMDVDLAITSIVTLPNGRVVLHFLGAPGRRHTVKASGDLVAFTTLGTATAAADGTFSFEDTSSAALSRRFYRVVFP